MKTEAIKEIKKKKKKKKKVEIAAPKIMFFVDDESELHDLFREVFEDEIAQKKLEIYCFKQGQDCLNSLKERMQNKQSTPIIFTDLNMPTMDGLSLTREIRKSYDHLNIPIYVISAYVAGHEKSVFDNLSIEKIIEKPFDFYKIKELLSL